MDGLEYRLADLFSGAGGLTLGFARLSAGKFRPVFAIDNNPESIQTYNNNFGPHGIAQDILAYLKENRSEVPRVDIVIGGPPCQGFSLLNKNRFGDPRKQLWRPFLDFVDLSGASMFLIENVPQLLGTAEHREIELRAGNLGFHTISRKLCAADYGVPQTRHRAFILGTKFIIPENSFPPPKTHYDPKLSQPAAAADGCSMRAGPWRTVRDAIADLSPPRDTEIRSHPSPYDLHFGRNPTELSLRRYRTIPGEGMNRFDLQRLAPELTPACWIRKKSGGTDLFGRLWWDRPSCTIRTEFYKPEKGRYLHPQEHRPLTHREAARLQTFPDDFQFAGSKTEIAKQIGNAVPPLLAAKIADSLYEILKRHISADCVRSYITEAPAGITTVT